MPKYSSVEQRPMSVDGWAEFEKLKNYLTMPSPQKVSFER